MPLIRGVQITGGLQVFGNQGGILFGRRTGHLIGCGRDAPVQLGAIGLSCDP